MHFCVITLSLIPGSINFSGTWFSDLQVECYFCSGCSTMGQLTSLTIARPLLRFFYFSRLPHYAALVPLVITLSLLLVLCSLTPFQFIALYPIR